MKSMMPDPHFDPYDSFHRGIKGSFAEIIYFLYKEWTLLWESYYRHIQLSYKHQSLQASIKAYCYNRIGSIESLSNIF